MSDPLIIAGREFGSRLFLGTAGYPNRKLMLDSIAASGTEMVTASIRRISLAGDDENLLLDRGVRPPLRGHRVLAGDDRHDEGLASHGIRNAVDNQLSGRTEAQRHLANDLLLHVHECGQHTWRHLGRRLIVGTEPQQKREIEFRADRVFYDVPGAGAILIRSRQQIPLLGIPGIQ